MQDRPQVPLPARGPTMAKKRKRRKKLVDRALQGRIIASFLLVSVFSILMQMTVVLGILNQVAVEVPGSGPTVAHQVEDTTLGMGLVSFLLTLPLTLLVALHLSFRVAGPLRRIQGFLVRVRAGQMPPDLRLRKHDALQDMAKLINDVTRPLREFPEDEEPEIFDLRTRILQDMREAS